MTSIFVGIVQKRDDLPYGLLLILHHVLDLSDWNRIGSVSCLHGFWLPNIQRPLVWREEQICRLFDSILREYPISTLLVWKTTEPLAKSVLGRVFA